MNQEETQIELSKLIQNDFIQIVTAFSERNMLDLNLVITFIQDINLLKTYKIDYLHNNEITEVMVILKEELKENTTARGIALLSAIDYLENPQSDFKQHLYVNLVLRTNENFFLEAFSFFNVVVSTVKELFEDFINYIFNDSFLDLTDQIQVSCIYKVWNTSQQLFNDNEASIFAYEKLKYLFEKALEKEKTEVAFWLYYTPLHYYNSGTDSNINNINEKFKVEIEKPLENYIKNKLVSKHNIKPNLKEIDKNKKIKVAFVMQRIINHSTVNVFYSLIKSLMNNPSSKYEFVIYDLAFAEAGGSDVNYVNDFKKLGISYVNLHENIFGNNLPVYSILEKSIKTREILINDGIDIFIGLHTRIEYIFLYATRTTPKQIYWYHNSNSDYDIEGVDHRLSHGSIPKNDFDFRKIDIYKDISYYNPEININEVNKIKNQFPEGSYILGSIGRLIKIEDKKYLKMVAEILKENPHSIYLACGSGDSKKISEMIEELEIKKEQFIFTGHVDSHLYGNILDLFLVPINGGGEALEEYRYKGKPYVALHKENLLDKNELKLLINAKEINEKLVIKDKNSMLFEPSLYNDKNLDFLIENQYIDKINKNAQMYYAISFAETKEEYIKIANEFITNEQLTSKVIKDLMYIYMNKDRNCDFEKFLEEIV